MQKEYTKNNIKDYFYFYDETNNYRGFHIKKGKFNEEPTNYFGLGGISFKMNNAPNILDLKSKLRVQKSFKEYKYNFFSRKETDFLESLKSDRWPILFDWLADNKIHIHYFLQNYLYFGIVDIVDEIIYGYDHMFAYIHHLKNDFYELMVCDLDSLLDVFVRYGYPNLTKDNHGNFMTEILDLVTYNQQYFDDTPENFFKEVLRQMIKANKNKISTSFLIDNQTGVLVDKQYFNYLSRSATFYQSYHYFDEEDIVQKEILCNVEVSKRDMNFEFVNSKDNPYIQVSDVIISLITRYYIFLEKIRVNEIPFLFLRLEDNVISNLRELIEIIDVSDKVSKYNIQFVGPQGIRIKDQLIREMLRKF